MTTKLVKWASNDGQIIKSGLSDGRRAKIFPSVVGFAYHWLRYECHLGNIGLGGERSDSTRRGFSLTVIYVYTVA